MLTYLLQSSTCLIILYGIYHFILAELTFFKYNRAYLLLSMLVSLMIPLLAPLLVLPEESVPVLHWSHLAGDITYIVADDEVSVFDWKGLMGNVLWIIYFVGVVVVLLKMMHGLFKIFRYYLQGQKEDFNGYRIITTEAVHLPFSFFKGIYVSRHVPLQDHIHTILEHEEIHIRQWHTLDVLMAEMVHAFFWFNPVMIFYKRALRQAHEYLADDLICGKNSVSSYTELLLSKSQSGLELALTNQFFHSQIKKRILMMTKNKTNRHAAWKYALVLPLLTGLVVVFSSPEIKSDVQKVFAGITDTIPATKRVSLDDVQTLSVKNETVRITLKNGKVESYNLSDSKESEIFQEKYGELAPPPLPPPPPMLHGNALMPEGVESIKVEEDRIIVKQTNGISKFFYLSDEGDMKTYKNFYGEIPKPPAPPSPPSPPSVNEQPPSFPPAPPPSNVNAIYKSWGNKPKPLIVIDGVIVEGEIENNIDPGDIDNITVLKGESATALYPNEGKNGVILIKSKGGKKDKSEIFKVVDQMPRFPGCEDQPTGYKRENCAKTKMLEYIYQNLKYPVEARKSQVEGQVVMQFVVKDDGSLMDIKVIRDIGGGCGQAVTEMLKTMNNMPEKWIPGRQAGKNVNVLYTLPVKFKLTDDQPKAELFIATKRDEKVNQEAYKTMLEMAAFPGSEHIMEPMERLSASSKMMSKFIQKYLKYPKKAKENIIEGNVYIRITIDANGKVSDAKIKEDIGFDCGEEALRVVKMMPNWFPATKDGKAVASTQTIPIAFKLKSDGKSLDNSILSKKIDIRSIMDSGSKFEMNSGSDVRLRITGDETIEDIGFKKGDMILVKNDKVLKEDVDYSVDYKTGKLSILNQKILEEKDAFDVSFTNGKLNSSLTDFVVKIFPNPSSDLIELLLVGSKEDVEVSILDMAGKLLYKNKFENRQEHFKTKIDISQINVPTILIKTVQGNKVYTKQIVIRK